MNREMASSFTMLTVQPPNPAPVILEPITPSTFHASYAVVLELGEVSGVIPDYLTACWRWAAAKSELVSGSELKIETLPAVTHCDSCGRDYPTVAHGKTCPHCQSGSTWLLTGNEVNIKEIEAY